MRFLYLIGLISLLHLAEVSKSHPYPADVSPFLPYFIIIFFFISKVLQAITFVFESAFSLLNAGFPFGGEDWRAKLSLATHISFLKSQL